MTQQEAIEVAKKYPQIKWVAMDSDGSWFGYDDKPDISTHAWVTFGNFTRLSRIENAELWKESICEITNIGDN